MGAIQSVNYPGDYPQKISPNNLPDITVVKVNKPGSYSSVTLVDRGDIKIVQKHFENQLRMLDSYLNLYQLFDGYDSKNATVIKDLEKKLINQKDELKVLYETRDKLRSNLDYSQKQYDKLLEKRKKLNIIIVILAIALPILILFIINEFRNYLEGDSVINNIQNNIGNNIKSN